MNPLKEKLYTEIVKQENSKWKEDGLWYCVSGTVLDASLTFSKEIRIKFKTKLLLLDFVDKMRKDPLKAWEDFRKDKPFDKAYHWESRSL